MTINGWDIANAGAKQWSVTPGFHAVSNSSSTWIQGSAAPNLFKNDIGFKTLKVKIMVKRNRDRQGILDGCSAILSRLLGPAELVLDDFNHKYFGILSKHTLTENALKVQALKYNKAAFLILEFKGYEYGDTVTATAAGQATVTVNNPGNILTPATITITPQMGTATLTITGICRDPQTGADIPVVVKDVVTGKAIVLDGETGLYTIDGKPAPGQIDIWEPPTMKPGNNTIKLSNKLMTVSIKVRPRYM